ERLVEVNVLKGQCYFFKTQYLKAYEVFHSLEHQNKMKDAVLFWLGETYLKGASYKEAEEHFSQLISESPNSEYTPQAYYSLGWVYFEQLNYDQAKNQFEILMNSYPLHELTEDASFKYGECLFHLKRFKPALKHFQNYASSYIKSIRLADAYFYIAESLYYLDEYLPAIQYYAKTADQAYDNNLILNSKTNMGWCYLKIQKYRLAEEAFNDALTFSNENEISSEDIYFGLANLFTEIKEYEKAEENYRSLIQFFPNSERFFDASIGLANIKYIQGEFDKAIEEYKNIIGRLNGLKISEDFMEKIYFGLAWAYLKNGSIDDSIQTFRFIENQAENDIVKISALTQIADAYQDIGELEKAIDVYDDILERYSDSIYTDYVQYRQGIALLKQDKIEAATLSFQSLENNFPESKYLKDIKYYLAVAYFKKQEWSMARSEIELFINDLDRESEFMSEAYYILGLANFNLKQYLEAQKIFEKIIQHYPQATSIIKNSQFYIAKCLANRNQLPQAIERFHKLVEEYPLSETSYESLYWLAEHSLSTGDFDLAIQHFETILRNFPGKDDLSALYYQLGQAYQLTNNYEKAIETLKLISNEQNPQIFAKAHLLIAEIFAQELDANASLQTYRNIITTSPEFQRDAYVKIAEIYKSINTQEKAVSAYQQALKSSKGYSQYTKAEIQFLIGDTYESFDNQENSVEEYLKIPYLYPNETAWIIKAYLRIGRIFENQEKWREAKTIYSKILEFDTDEQKFALERINWIDQNILQILQ
ncbi:MAG: tetratricopeptide repeat protein, partial [Candidatus Omnitrophica bacterium]|nr:tetratricopeptide repeat protein [Candidatus Omnitrophota bacterium]